MKHKAYTFAEMLMTLVVIGIIAAVTAPLINKYKPDTTKILYLKTYDTISGTLSKLVSNEKFYPSFNSDKIDPIYYKNYPFYNTVEVKVNEDLIGGDNKLCKLLARTSRTGVDDIKCGDEYLAYKSGVEWKPSFSYNNGVEVYATTKRIEPTSDNNYATYKTELYFDINGVKNGENCLYSKEDNPTCKSPDIFKLVIGADGEILPGDAYGNIYLKKRVTWRKNDITPSDLEKFDDSIKFEPDKFPIYSICDKGENKDTLLCKCIAAGNNQSDPACICLLNPEDSACTDGKIKDPEEPGKEPEEEPEKELNPAVPYVGEVGYTCSCEPSMFGATIPLLSGDFVVEEADKLYSLSDYNKLFSIFDSKVHVPNNDCIGWLYEGCAFGTDSLVPAQ